MRFGLGASQERKAYLAHLDFHRGVADWARRNNYPVDVPTHGQDTFDAISVIVELIIVGAELMVCVTELWMIIVGLALWVI